MNGPEFRLLRRSLFLSGQQVADRLGIKSARTIRYWEAGRLSVPDDAARHLLSLDEIIEDAVDEALEELDATGVVLLTYRDDADVAGNPGLAGPGASDLHQAMISRIWREHHDLRIVYFDRAAFERWLLAEHLDETPATHVQWATSQA